MKYINYIYIRIIAASVLMALLPGAMVYRYGGVLGCSGVIQDRYFRWANEPGQKAQVPFYIDYDTLALLPSDFTSAQAETALIQAAATWSSSGANLNLKYLGRLPAGQGTETCDGKAMPSGNIIKAGLIPENAAWVGVNYHYTCKPGLETIQKFLIVLSTTSTWSLSAANLNLKGVATHELGHAIGLLHAQAGVTVGDPKTPGTNPPCDPYNPADPLDISTDPRQSATMCTNTNVAYSQFQSTLANDDRVGVLTLYPSGGGTEAVLFENETIANYSNPAQEQYWRKSSFVPTSNIQRPVAVLFSIKNYWQPQLGLHSYRAPWITAVGQEATAGETWELATFMCKRCDWFVDQLGYRVKRGNTPVHGPVVETTQGIAVTESHISAIY